MLVVPADTPVNTPVADPIVATLVEPELHVPPVVPSLKVAVEPAQSVSVPVIDAGPAFTVIVFIAVHPEVKL